MNDTELGLIRFCSVTLYSHILFSLIVWYCIFPMVSLYSVWYHRFVYYLASTSSWVQLCNFHDDYKTFPYLVFLLSYLFIFIQTRKHFGLSSDGSRLSNPAANSHPGRHQALLSKPGKLLWFSRQHRVGNDVLSGAPPLEWLRAMFVGVVWMHQSHRWMEWTPAATVQHSNYLPVN